MRISRSSLRKRRAQPNRRRFFEKLETRLLLTSAWQAPHNQLDVSGDGVVSPLDALVGINRLNEIGAGVLPTPATPPPYYDTNGDGDHSPIDVLLIINALNDTNIPETQIQLDLARDTAPEQSTNDDFITSDPRVIGTVSAYLGIASLTAALDGGQAFGLPFELSGEFMLDPILQLDGNDDGQHQLQVIAVDGGGRSTVANLSFFLDTVAPTIDTFGIVPSQAQPDGSTELEFVAMAGITQPNVPVELSPGDFQTVSNAQGEFRFGDYPLAVGANDLTVRVIDLAGNQSDLEYSITRTSAIAFELQEEGRFLTEDSLLVELGQNTGTRQLRFTLDVDFDGSDTTSYLGDVLLVYLLDPQDLSQTLLDGGAIGKPLLEFREDDVNFPAGLVTFDGFTAEIEVSSLADETEGLLWFQLIGHDADTASRVTVGKIANELDSEGIASPIFPPSRRPQQPGPAFDDLASLQPSQNLRLLFEKRSFNSQTGRYGAEIRIQNEGGPAGRQVAVAFSDLDSGITLSNRSGTTAGSAPYLNLSAAMPPGGLSSGEISDAVEIEFDNSDLLTLSFVPKILAGISNRAPVFSAVEPITIQPGGFFQRPLSVFDPDGDPIVFSIDSDGPMPTGSLDAEGNLVITPRPEDVGDYRFRVLATDGTEVVSQVVLVHVVPPSNPLVTRIEGTIEDVDEDPLGGVPVELDDEQMVTDADGDFYIEFDEPLEDPTLMVHGDLLVGTLDFPFIAEGLELLLGHELFSGATNVIRRPIFLPAIDTANAVPIDPSVTTTVTTPKIPGAAVVVQAGSAKDRQQQLFRGALSITEVPVNRTPAVLPQGQTPNMVVTIQPAELPFTTPAPLALPNAAAYRSGSQPAELQFTTPAPLSLPNTAAYPSGTVLDLWSSNPKTGTFNIVGTGRVSTEGNLIETVSGGIRNSGWYFFTPPPTEPTDPNTNIRNEQSLCEACKARVTGNSEVELHSGALQASHELASYQSLGVARGFTLRYDSLRADPRPIIHFGYDNVPPDPTVRLAANLVIEQGDFSIDVPGRPSQDLGLSSAENYWSIPASGGDIDVALQAELRGQPSGRYEYSLTSGLLRENSGQFAGSQSTVQGSLLHVDTSDSPFGIGWGLAGLQELAINPDGSVLLIDGDGSELIFEAPLAPGQPYVSPAGDFSVLERLPDDSFRRTATDQTVYAFNSSNKLASITDRNGNQTVFTYTANRLTSITDPVGLVTTFSYTADRITGVTDPASRTTVLEYDAAGNLERIVDPDSEDRTFEYDDRHLLTAEITKRGFREETVYDFAGRVVGRTTADGAEIEIAPLQTQELLLPSATQNPFAAPEAFLRSDPIAFHTDGNGNTFATELDQYGQRVFSFDGEGNQDRIQRNAQNLVTAITDARGATTQYQYDTVGNLTAVIQESLTVGNSFGTALPAGELTNGTRSFDGFVGDLAPIDVYQFELDAASRVRVHLGDLVEEASVTVVTDTDNDGVFDRGTESLESAVGSPLNDAFFTEVLPPGAYFVVIEPDTFPQGENTSYTLELGAEPVTLTTASDPGNTLADATDLGVLQSAQSLQDIVGDLDPVDTFRFEVTQNNSPVWIRLSDVDEGVDFRLGQDLNQNGVLQSGETLRTGTAGPANPDQIFERLDVGTYFLELSPDTFPQGENTTYRLELEVIVAPSTQPHVDNGNALGNAMNIGTLGASAAFSGSIRGDGGDSDDFIKFTLNQPTLVRMELTGLTDDARLGLVADVNSDLQINSRDKIETSQFRFGDNPEWLEEELPPGIYYARVYHGRFDAGRLTNYDLEITTSPLTSTTGGDPGNFLATAYDLGLLTGPVTHQDAVGALDTDDYYKFTLDSAATVSAQISELNENLGVAIVADIDGDGVHDSDDTLEFFADGTKGRQRVVEELAPGTYFFQVFQRTFREDENSHYVLDVDISTFATTPSSDPGNDFASAVVIDPFAGPQTFRENVGALDADDYYKFTLDAAATVTAQISELNEDLDVAIVADINGNGVHDSNETLEFTSGGGKGRQRVVEELAPGTYFFWVFQRTFGEALNSHYRLDVDIWPFATTPASDPGNDFASAVVIDPFVGPQTFRENVGALDKNDYYKFTLDAAATVTAQISELNEDLDVAIVADINGNGVHDSNETLESTSGGGKGRQRVVEELAPGTYFFWVFQRTFGEALNSHYRLDVDIWPFATTPASDPGNDFASAVVIDPFVGLQTFRENVGALDADDYYKFTLDAAATVTAQISELNEDLDVAIVADINGNGVRDSNETLEFTSGGGKGRQRVVEELAPGTYFFWVFQRTFGEALNSHYRLDVDIAAIGSLQVDDPGETLVTATDLGALGSSLTVSDIVGALDVSDFYRFTIGTAQTVQVLLRGLAEDLQLQLIDDANGNGIIDNGEDLAASRRSRNSSESMVASLQAGTYFVRVYQDNFAESENSSYELSIRTPTAATANPSDPGGNLPSAANLGTLNGAVARSDFVGDSDADDFYRIRLDEPREVRVLLSGLAEDADVRLIADVDGNLAIASGEVIESSNSSGSDHDFISEDLGPGDYFVHVFQPSFPANQNTNYNLEITSTPLAISTASDPGELLPAAMDIGNLTTPQVFQGYIGSLDTQDLYRFTMQTQGEVRATLGGLVEDATLSIVADVNANLAIDSGEVIESITSSSNGLVVLTETLPPGDYFLRVVQDTFPVGENSRYQLEAEAVGAPRNTIADPGETLPAALDLGTLQLGTLVAKQTLRESVGDLDQTDLYRFELDEIAEIRINAEGLQEDAIISLIADVNGNFAIDSGESIESVTTSQGNPALLDETLPPGVYYLRVEQDTFPVGENTAYDIALEALPAIRSSIRDPGETILDALDIDVLGEPSISDAVGNLDLADIYRFALAQTTEVSVDLAGLSEDIIVEVIADANNDNVIAAAEVTEQATSSEGELQLTETLGPGTYFLRIRPDTFPLGENTAYDLSVRTKLLGESFGIRTFTYESTFSQLISETDELGRKTIYEVDPTDGNILSQTRIVGEPDGTSGELNDVTIEFTYNAPGQIETITDARDRVTRYRYDANGRIDEIILAEFLADETAFSFEYDAAGNVIEFDNDNDDATTFAYDALNRLTVVTTPDPDAGGPRLPASTAFAYDAAGNLNILTQPDATTIGYTYDGLDRLSTVVDDDEHATIYDYDLAGNLVALLDPLGNETQNRFDERNRLIESIDPEGNSVKHTYDQNDNLVRVTDPLDNTTEYFYDVRNRLQRTIDARGETTTFAYDAVDNRVSKVDRNGRRTQFVYDDLDRLVDETWLDATAAIVNSISYEYDTNGNLLEVEDDFSTIEFTYDSLDRRLTADTTGTPNAPDVVLNYDYDGIGSVLSVSETIGGSAAGVTSYVYDARNLVTQASQTGAGTVDKRADFAYDDLGRITTIERFTDLAGTNSIVASTYSYDTLGQISQIVHNNGTDDVAFFDDTYDAAGRIQTVADVNGMATYGYNRNGFLTSAVYTDLIRPDELYTYDAGGNRTSANGVVSTIETANRLANDGTFSYEYDDEGNVIRRTNTASGKSSELVYDHRNRLTAVISKDAGQQELERIEYTFDALNQMIAKRSTNAGGAIIDYFVYDRDDLLLSFFDADGDGPAPPSLDRRFFNVEAVDQVLAEESFGSVGWLLADHLGSVRDVIDANGQIGYHVIFDAFGKAVFESDPDDRPLHGFAGKLRDIDTGLTAFGLRAYSPEIGRFTSQVPRGLVAGYTNLYAFNDAVNQAGSLSLIEPKLALDDDVLGSFLFNRIVTSGRADVPAFGLRVYIGLPDDLNWAVILAGATKGIRRPYGQLPIQTTNEASGAFDRFFSWPYG